MIIRGYAKSQPSWVKPEVMKITHNMVLIFIQFLFGSTNHLELFWILDCGLVVSLAFMYPILNFEGLLVF